MRMTTTTLADLRAAIKAAGGLRPEATMRNRWDVLWRSGFDVNRLYGEGLDDNHIDTALRHIAKRPAIYRGEAR